MKTYLEKAIILFKTTSASWIANIISKTSDKNALERAIELIVESSEFFGARPTEIGASIPPIDKDKIEAIICAVKKDRKFKAKRISQINDSLVVAAWELTKYNSSNKLVIELMHKNYVHICGNDYNLYAYGYFTLENSIKGWAKNRM